MTTATIPAGPLPQWLVDAVMGLVASAYEAGRADRSAEVQPSPTAEADVLDVFEAMALLRCKRTKLNTLVRGAVVPSLLIGGRRMFRRADLDRWLEQQAVQS